jgi:hypothetical protein
MTFSLMLMPVLVARAPRDVPETGKDGTRESGREAAEAPPSKKLWAAKSGPSRFLE